MHRLAFLARSARVLLICWRSRTGAVGRLRRSQVAECSERLRIRLPTFAGAAISPLHHQPRLHPRLGSRLSRLWPSRTRVVAACLFLAVWATLRAYGRNGYREMVERHLYLAQRMARLVDEAPDLERLAGAPLNIVCFRYHPSDVDEDALDELNKRLGAAILADGRVSSARPRTPERSRSGRP